MEPLLEVCQMVEAMLEIRVLHFIEVIEKLSVLDPVPQLLAPVLTPVACTDRHKNQLHPSSSIPSNYYCSKCPLLAESGHCTP